MTIVPPTPTEVQLLREEIAHLRTQIAWLKQQLFGPGKSETLDRAQLLLTLGELEKLAAKERPVETICYERPKGPGSPRTLPAENFAALPVKETVELVPAAVQAEPELYERIGEERTFEVDVTPPRLFKREIVRPKYRHRLEQMSQRWGATIPRQTMADWIGLTAGWLEPIYRRMYRGLIEGGYVQADETPIRCNDPDEKRGGTSQGWLWVISKPGGDVVFDWRLSRRHGELTSLLADYRGILQSDGYEAYPSFARSREGVVWVGCWAHARRYFFEALGERPKAVQLVLRLIGQLYRFEREWDEAQVGDRRAVLRQSHFARPLYWLRRIVLGLRGRVLPRSLLGKACSYLLDHGEPLVAHLQHSQTRLDNNLVENAIRPSAIGKKNWLFIGHPDAGQRSAIIYSLVVSCQRHGKDPLAYLRDVLTRLPAMTNQDDLAPLAPARWQPALS